MKKNNKSNHKSKKPKKKKSNSNNVATKKNHREYLQFAAKSSKNGTVTFNFDPDDARRITSPQIIEGTTKSYRTYDRDSGKPKVVTQAHLPSNGGYASLMRNLTTNYDMLAVMDTNTFQYEGDRFSVCCPCVTKQMDNPLEGKKKSYDITFARMHSIIIKNVPLDSNPEVVGWYLFILHFLPTLNLTSGKTLAMVVDSELGKHADINKRLLPYYKDEYLPEKIELIYASSDTGDDPINKAIKWCDKSSNITRAKIESKQIDVLEGFKQDTDNDFSYKFFSLDKLDIVED
jgi:hypothetical protein